MNIILDAVADCSGQTLDFFYSQRLLFPSFLFFSSIIFALGLKEPSSVSAGLKPLMNWCLYAWECSVKVFTSFCESTIRRTEKKNHTTCFTAAILFTPGFAIPSPFFLSYLKSQLLKLLFSCAIRS